MEKSLIAAITEVSITSKERLNPSITPEDLTSSADSSVLKEADLLRLFGVYSYVVANRPDGTFPESGGYLDVSRVEIDNKPHKIINLRNGHVINLLNQLDCVVIKVRGDSMDQKGIDDGDYVLIRPQSTAQQNDIVVAEIDNLHDNHEGVSLKLFQLKGDRITLMPCSNNPRHKAMKFDLPVEHLIRGIALAVFKQVDYLA